MASAVGSPSAGMSPPMYSSPTSSHPGYSVHRSQPQQSTSAYWQASSQTPVSSRDPRFHYSSSGDAYSPADIPQASTSVNPGPRPDMSGFSKLSVPTLPVLTDQEYIEHAARKAEQLLQRDLECPTLYTSLTVPAGQTAAYAGTRPVSGSMEHDYPPVIDKGLVTQNLFSLVYKAPIPTELNELLNHSDVGTCHMGVFPEVYRAWMTIDSDLYLWDFRDGSDLSFYDALKEPILTLALVKAKPGVFLPTIKNLLCISTASEIVILGFVISKPDIPTSPSEPVLELVSQPIFVVSSDQTIFTVMVGSDDGRIFLGATNGSIQEIDYQAGRGWISDRVWKTNLTSSYLGSLFKFLIPKGSPDPIAQIVIDNIRKVLFTRSATGGIQAYDLGSDGKSFHKIGHLTFEEIIASVVNISKKTLDGTIVKKILSISAIEYGEISLVAVLESGTRLYFSCYNPPSNGLRDKMFRPVTLQLVHIRLPPGYCSSTAMRKPSICKNGFYMDGVFALSSPVHQDEDCLWLISPFLYPTNSCTEVACIHQLPGTALDIKGIPENNELTNNTNTSGLPEVIKQHLPGDKQIVVLTVNGTAVFRAMKPYEQLKDLLVTKDGGESLKGHYELGLSPVQPLANTVLVATHPSFKMETNVYEMAKKAFFKYGSEYPQQPQHFQSASPPSNSPLETTMEFNPNLVSTPRQDGMRSPTGISTSYVDNQSIRSPPLAGGEGFYQPTSGQPFSSSYYQPTHGNSPSSPPQHLSRQSEVIFSSRHDALYLIASRVLLPLWTRPVVRQEIIEGSGNRNIIVPNITGAEVTYAMQFLNGVLVFIESNREFYLVGRSVLSGGARNVQESTMAYNSDLEKMSILGLKKFINLALEVFGMWKIVCDHQFHIVLHGVDEHLKNTTMKDLIVSGQGIINLIINALISKYLGDNAAVDAISLRLREVCPTLFKNEDAIGSKVAELLGKAKNTTDNFEKTSLVKESLTLCEKICGHGRVNVRTFCKQYAELGFPSGAVRLCISTAKACDPEQMAVSALKGSGPTSDPQILQLLQARADVYKIVFEILDNYVAVASSKQSPLSSKVAGDERPSSETAQSLANETINAIINSDDEMFHITLYDWLLERKLFDRLLEIKHTFLDGYLQRAAESVVSGKWSGSVAIPANDTRMLDLLWRHHELNQNHGAAAHILSKLADSTTTGLNLQQRVEYLSRAILCAKSCYRRGNILEALEDKLEVAQIQKQILDSVSDRLQAFCSNSSEDRNETEFKVLQDAVHRLNSQLYNISVLYSDFAHPLKLHEAKLNIFYAAGHGEKALIEGIWSDIIEAELQSSGRQSTESQMELIKRKLVMLGHKYINSPSFFPLEFLVEHLEAMKPTDTDNIGWVFKTMLEIGVGVSDLLGLYEKLWKRFNSRQGAGGSDVQMARVIVLMIELFAKQELQVHTSFFSKSEMKEKCKDLIASMIVEYSSRFDTVSSSVTQQLNEVKERLDRVRF